MKTIRAVLLLWLCSCAAAIAAPAPQQRLPSSAPVASIEVLRVLISRLVTVEGGVAICVPQGLGVDGVRARIEPALQRAGVQGLPSAAQVTQALHTQMPCPFSPYRPELR